MKILFKLNNILYFSCTSNKEKYCKKKYETDNNIVQPIVTGKITTKNKFSFKYGKIEVKAKFPIGPWIFPG